MSMNKQYLEDFNDEFENAEIQDGFNNLPDGKYQARLDVIRLDPNPHTGFLHLSIELVVCTGEHDGRRIFYSKPVRQDQIQYVKTDLARLGIKPTKFSLVEQEFPSALDKIVDIQLKTSKPNGEGKIYQNTYINKVVGEAPKTDKEVPF